MANPNSKEDPKNPQQKGKIPMVAFYVMLAVLLGMQLLFMQQSVSEEISWNKFETEILSANDVDKIEIINKEKAEIHLKSKPNGPHYHFNIGSIDAFENKLATAQEKYNSEGNIDVKYVTRTNWVGIFLSWVLPFVIIIGLWIFLMRRAGNSMGGGMGGRNPFDFGKSKAKLFEKNDKSNVTFADVAGLEEAKVEIMEIVDFLKQPEEYIRLGAKIPKGVILAGPPGTGKTLLAKAVAGEAKVPFLSMSGSEFVEMFVGVGASRVRDLFKRAKEKSPSIIFIDEIDAIGRSRGKAFSLQPNDERESTLNQLLTEMDGFGDNTGVIVLAATNRPDVLDKALMRPGRFDRHIYLELPNLVERNAIFKVHMRRLKLAKGINMELLAGQTPGFSGADIANICNEAALIAARKKKKEIFYEDFMEAIDRVIGGLERKSKIITPNEKRIIAFHEAGHATASWFLKHADELVKVTIVPRGKSLGAAWYLPEELQILTSTQLIHRICATLGGRAAEDIIFGEVSSGAINDLEKVTKQAFSMVAYYGLNDKLGNISFYDSSGRYEQSLQKPYSEATAQLLDEEVRKLVQQAYKKTVDLLTKHKKEMTELAELLLEKEVIYKEDLEQVFGKREKKEG